MNVYVAHPGSLNPSDNPPARVPRDGGDSGEHDAAVDRTLVARMQAGGPADKDAWTQLILRHQRRIYATCLRFCNNPETASDLTQDVFVKVIQSINAFDNRSRLTTWMTRIAINVCLSHRRAARVRRTQTLSDTGGTDVAARRNSSPYSDLTASSRAPGSENLSRTDGGFLGGELQPEQSVELHERRKRLYSALAELEPDQRALLILRDVQGLEYEQIAEVLGVPLGTLKSRLFRARLALRRLMEGGSEPMSVAEPD